MTLDKARKLKEEILICQELGFLGRDDIKIKVNKKSVTITVPNQRTANSLPATVRNLKVNAKVGKVAKPKAQKKK